MRLRVAAMSIIVLALSACGTNDASDDVQATATGGAADGPVRVAALSSDAAEAARALVGAERLVAVPASTTNPHLGHHPEEMAQVPNQVPPSDGLDPERVLSWNPDLVLVTARHDGEQDSGELLEQADVPVVTIENNWGSVDELQDNLRLIGIALNAEEAADEIIAAMDVELAGVTEDLGSVTDPPSVLVLTNQAADPFIAGPDAMPTDLVRLAGAVPAIDEAGIGRTMPADPEQVVRTAPDAILLVDVLGKGQESFDSVLGNEAVAQLPAVVNGTVMMLPGRSAMAAGGAHIIGGVREIAAWLHPEQFADSSG